MPNPERVQPNHGGRENSCQAVMFAMSALRDRPAEPEATATPKRENRRLRACVGKNEPMEVATHNNVTRVGDRSGPTVVLAHGFGCDQQLWHPVASRLQDRFDLVLFDHVDSGNAEPAARDPDKYASLTSYAADVVELIDALDLRDVVFVGHSVAARQFRVRCRGRHRGAGPRCPSMTKVSNR